MHEERIAHDDGAGIGAAGMATVERLAEGERELETRVSGHDPGRRYKIPVDWILAGAVTADAVGQARLELEAPVDSNPLPADLQPVGDLRLVLMTITTALGPVPLLLSTVTGSEVEPPLAAVVVGDLFTSTALIRLVLPAISPRFAEHSGDEDTWRT